MINEKAVVWDTINLLRILFNIPQNLSRNFIINTLTWLFPCNVCLHVVEYLSHFIIECVSHYFKEDIYAGRDGHSLCLLSVIVYPLSLNLPKLGSHINVI